VVRVERATERDAEEVRMPNKSSALGRRPLWIRTSYKHTQMQPPTLDPNGDGGFLPEVAPGKRQRLGNAREANHSPHHQDNDLQCAKPAHNP